ncbi:hypothetical protein ACHAQA_006466 [Verticillium albo-atrum]
MPPRRRKRASGAEQPAVAPSSPPTSDPNEELHEPPPPFFNTSFSTHRASPLYTGNESLSPARLNELALRLRDTLVGDVVRGVQVGLEGSDTSLGRAGSLERVVIRWFDTGALLGQEAGRIRRPVSRDLSSDAVFGSGAAAGEKKGLCIEMRYENALCTAVMLPLLDGKGRASEGAFTGGNGTAIPGSLEVDTDMGNDDSGRFIHLPLLLLRMPTPMKVFVTDFLSRTFDCRISPLRLGTRSLVGAWERWIELAGLPSQGPLAKDLVLTLGFYTPPTEPAIAGDELVPVVEGLGIKSIDIIIPPVDLGRFVQIGESRSIGVKRKSLSRGWESDPRKRSKLAGGSSEEGWAWRASEGSGSADEANQPFIEALADYFDKHLAIDLFHPSVQIAKIACGGFALSENRIKVFSLSSGDHASTGLSAPRAVWRLVSDLVNRAA